MENVPITDFASLPTETVNTTVHASAHTDSSERRNEASLSYWKERLSGAPPLLELPTDRPRPAVQNFHGATTSLCLSSDLTTGLRQLSCTEDATLFMTLLAAFQTLLYRYSAQEQIVVGSLSANCTHNQTENVIGCFSNSLALHTDLSANPSFVEVLARVKEVCLGAYAHQDLPFEKLVAALQPQHSLSYSPIYQVMFLLQSAPRESLQMQGLQIQSLGGETITARCDLLMTLSERGDTLTGGLEYNTALFDADTIDRMLDNFQTLLHAIIADPQQKISLLPLLSEKERCRMLVEWNATEQEYSEQCGIHTLFEQQVERTPEAIAVAFEGRQLTYQQLNARANQLAHFLQQQGVGPDVCVGLCTERSLEMMVGVLGILKAGGAYVPIDLSYPPSRAAFMLRDARVALVLTHGDIGDVLSQAEAPQIPLKQVDPLLPAQNLTSNTHPLCAAYVIYTSGSTGQPKGVVMHHEALVNLVRWQLQALPAKARTLQFTSIGFDVSFQEIFTTWCRGGTLVLIRELHRRDPAMLLQVLERENIERLFVPYAVLQHLTLQTSSGAPPSLREVITAGEQLQSTPEIVRFFSGTHGPTLHNHYGPTEAHVVTAYELQGSPQQWPPLPPIGRPIANAFMRVLDRNLMPVPIGVAGELYIGGTCLSRGYLARPDLTAERFVPDPFPSEPGTRLYRTGDQCRYLADGNIEYLGRLDHQVKVRGFRIELGEIENVLLQHPGIKEAVVLVREDVPGDKRIVAYMVGSSGAIPVSALREHLSGKLPEYMAPSAFVWLEYFPLSTNGKIDRKALPAPEADRLDLAAGRVAPRDAIEAQLCRLWEQALGVHPIGVTDSFRELGGTSLLAAKLFRQIQETFQRELPLSVLIQSPTIAHIASILRQADGDRPAPSLLPIKTSGAKRPFFCIHGAGANVLELTMLADYIAPDQPLYGLQSQGLDGKVEPLTIVEEMATQYIAEIRQVQPKGPYLLGGFSFGGIVAYEMAQQLYTQGERVALLALLDTNIPYRQRRTPHHSAVFLRRIYPFVANVEQQLLDLRRRGGAQYVRHRAAAFRNSLKIRLFKLRHRELALLPNEVIDWSPTLRKVWLANLQAERVYQAKPYSGRVTLFWANEWSVKERLSRDSRLYWAELAEGGMEVQIVPGDHNTMREDANVSALVHRLNVCLSRAHEAILSEEQLGPTASPHSSHAN